MTFGSGRLAQAVTGTAHPLLQVANELTSRLATQDWICLTMVLAAIAISARLGMWAYCALTLPGTLAHELAHFLVALVLGARPTLPNLIPVRESGAWRMGSVTFGGGILRSVPIALAPLALAPLSLWWAGNFLPEASSSTYALHVWIASTMFSASLPSSQDWTIAAPALLILALAATAARML